MYWVFLVYIFLYFYFFAIKIYLTLNPLFPLQLNSFSLKFSKTFNPLSKKQNFHDRLGKNTSAKGANKAGAADCPMKVRGFPKKTPVS